LVERLHGFSTTIEAHARGAAAFGADFRTVRLPVTTLAALCDAHRPERIDFLKVDVEGAEADVLAGADWQRWRPRVLVVEAMTPGSLVEGWRDWEPLLLRHGYEPAFFDGLNRFYVAKEEAALAARFPEKPAAWNVVLHLYEFGRAPDNPEHPDHALARQLVGGFLAALPRLDPTLLSSFLDGHIEAQAIDTDGFRAALGRIASTYDGGQIMEDEPSA
jgi:hypothetical protein